MKKNLRLENIRVKSFMTSEEQKKVLKGGNWTPFCFRVETCECTSPEECPSASC